MEMLYQQSAIIIYGRVIDLNFPPCQSLNSNKNEISHKMKVIFSVFAVLMFCLTLLVCFLIFLCSLQVLRKRTPSESSFKHTIDVASALKYLHCHCNSMIIHGDLNPNHVLLDDEMTAHVGTLCLRKLQHQSNSIAVRGTGAAMLLQLGDIS